MIKTIYQHIFASECQPLKIMQISDLHIGNLQRPEKKFAAIYETYLKVKPKVVVITGDILGHTDTNESLPEQEIVPYLVTLDEMFYDSYVFWVDGNHDHVGSNLALLRDNLKNSICLTDTSCYLKEFNLNLSGFHDYFQEGEVNYEPRLDAFNVLLAHNPATIIKAEEEGLLAPHLPYLALAGHTHGGEVTSNEFLARLAVKLFPNCTESSYPYPDKVAGMFKLAEPDKYLYINRGVYTHKFRLLVPREITIFTLDASKEVFKVL